MHETYIPLDLPSIDYSQYYAFIFHKKLLCKKLVLNFLSSYNINKIGGCSHHNSEQKKN